MRLIDADELWKLVIAFRDAGPEKKAIRKYVCNAILLALIDEKETPTIDPSALRPKGEWIYNTDDFTPKKRCTNCGYNKPIVAGEGIEQEPSFFCPNCGADMRKGEDDG